MALCSTWSKILTDNFLKQYFLDIKLTPKWILSGPVLMLLQLIQILPIVSTSFFMAWRNVKISYQNLHLLIYQSGYQSGLSSGIWIVQISWHLGGSWIHTGWCDFFYYQCGLPVKLWTALEGCRHTKVFQVSIDNSMGNNVKKVCYKTTETAAGHRCLIQFVLVTGWLKISYDEGF